MGNGAFSSGVKRPKREADHLTSSDKINNAWCFNFSPPYVFVIWCLSTEQLYRLYQVNLSVFTPVRFRSLFIQV
jgi:hypothetical protein